MIKQKNSTLSNLRCYHCGEPTIEATTIVTDDKPFCCEGCKFVYELLRDNHLCTYYDLNERSGISLKNVLATTRRSRFDYLEDPLVQRQLLEFSNKEI